MKKEEKLGEELDLIGEILDWRKQKAFVLIKRGVQTFVHCIVLFNSWDSRLQS